MKVGNLLLFFAGATLCAGRAAAQAGHAPEASPYHDLVAKQAASFIGGYLSGPRGTADVGPTNGPIAGIRYDHLVGTPLDILVGLSVAHLNRFVVDPGKPPATRTSGPVNQDLIMMETGMSLVLMGRKTWHGLSPYLGGTVGVAFETGLSSDASLYSFGTKAVLSPQFGIKWYPVQAFAIKIEARDYIWRLSYPSTFYIQPASNVPAVLAATDPTHQWTQHPAVLFSIGYTFAPF